MWWELPHWLAELDRMRSGGLIWSIPEIRLCQVMWPANASSSLHFGVDICFDEVDS